MNIRKILDLIITAKGDIERLTDDKKEFINKYLYKK